MAIEVTTAMVFAAGFGQRLRPRTDHTPKPLIEVAGRSMLERALDSLEASGVRRAVVNTHHLAAQVHEAVLARRRSGRGPDIVLAHEEPILETGGGVVNALGLLGRRQPFLSVNADVIWLDGPTPAVERLAATFDPDTMDALLLLAPVERALGYRGAGDFALEEGGQLSRATAPRPYVFTGLQIWHPRAFAGRRVEPFSLSEVYRERTGSDGRVSRCYGLVHDGAWLHVGSEQELCAAEAFLGSVHE